MLKDEEDLILRKLLEDSPSYLDYLDPTPIAFDIYGNGYSSKQLKEKENMKSKDKEVKLLTYDEITKFRPRSSVDYITQWTREETYLINKYKVEMMEKENAEI